MPPSSLARHQTARHWSSHQAGVIARRQLESVGWTDSMIRAQLRASRWQTLFRGTYLTETGEPSMAAWCWGAHLLMGDRSYLLGRTALQAWGLGQAQLPVQIGIPWNDSRAHTTDSIEVSRHRLVPPVRHPTGMPPTERVEYAVIDATQKSRSHRYVEQLVTDACQRGLVKPDDILKAMGAHRRVRFRGLIKDLLAEYQDGSTTVLEVDAVRLVLRAHGLPTGRGQVREYQDGAVVYRDRVIEEFGLVLEFDGRLGHADPTGRLRDFRRDNAVAASGRIGLRFGWTDVHEDACAAALQIALVLNGRGWTGQINPCGPYCCAV